MFGNRSILRHWFLNPLISSTAFGSMMVSAAPPAWWSNGNPPVVNPDADENNHGVVNVGQAKWMAKNAVEALRKVLPDVAAQVEGELVGDVAPVGANKPIATWSAPTTEAERLKQRAPLLVGQLKAIAAPFYNKLHTAAPAWVASERTLAGIPVTDSHLPWTSVATDDANRAPALVGQLKAVFSLDFAADRETAGAADGLPDLWEIRHFGNLSQNGSGDFDNDHVTNAQEYEKGTSPTTTADSDADGLPDDWEMYYFGHLKLSGKNDPDNDLLTNAREWELGTNPTLASPDRDADGLPDEWELHWFGNLNQTASGDYDQDGPVNPANASFRAPGLTNLQELQLGTNPTSAADTDGDGLPDDWERFWFGGLTKMDPPFNVWKIGIQNSGNSYETLRGDSGRDFIFGLDGGGGDSIYGDEASGGSDESDFLVAGYSVNGTFSLYGDAGDDALLGNHSHCQLHGGPGNDVLLGGNYMDVLYGDDGDDVLFGGDNPSTTVTENLYGGNGNDELTGGKGDDGCAGGLGSDKYYWNLGDGMDDRLHDDKNELGANNVLVLGPGIKPADIRFSILNASTQYLTFEVWKSNAIVGRVRIADWYTQASGSFIRHCTTWKIEFDDGTIWRGAGLGTPGDDDYTGTDEDDYIASGTGTDVLRGGQGDDIYYWNLGDGFHTLDDAFVGDQGENRLVFGPGIDPATIVASANGNKLRLKAPGQTGMVEIASWFSGQNVNWRIEFANGVVWDGRSMVTSWNDTIVGTDGPDVLNGGAGNDTINGGLGDDVLEGGVGNDTLNGGGGRNTFIYRKGTGNDTITAGDHSDGSEKDVLELPDLAYSEISLSRYNPNGTSNPTSGSVYRITGGGGWVQVTNGEMLTVSFVDGTILNFTQAGGFNVQHASPNAYQNSIKDTDGDRVPDWVELEMGTDHEDGGDTPNPDATVSPTGTYTTIADALQAAEANRGGRACIFVRISPGVYTEQLNVNTQGVFLQGAGETYIKKPRFSLGHRVKGRDIVFQGIHFGDGTVSDSWHIESQDPLHGIVFYNCAFKGVALPASATAATRAFYSGRTDFVHCTLLDCDGAMLEGDARVFFCNSLVVPATRVDWKHPERIYPLTSKVPLPLRGSTTTDPKVNPEGYLLPGSPAIGAATPMTGQYVDINGEARDTTPDIGSDEFVDAEAGGGDGLPDAWEIKYFGNLANTGGDNPDGDNLTNAQELVAGSNPNAAIAPAVSIGAVYAPSNYETVGAGGNVEFPVSATVPCFTTEEGYLQLSSRQGSIVYSLQNDRPRLMALRCAVTGQSGEDFNTTTTTYGSYCLVLLDDRELGIVPWDGQQAFISMGIVGAGEHKVEFRFRNFSGKAFPRLKSLEWLRFDDEEKEESVMDLLVGDSITLAATPEGSQVNPICLEGRYFSTLPEVKTGVVHPTEETGIAKGWYSNVALDASGAFTNIKITFGNEEAEITTKARWVATELANSPDLTIRKGDSLRLLATTVLSGNVTYEANGQTLGQASPGAALAHQFNNTGVYVLSARDASGVLPNQEVTVKVVSANFSQTPGSQSAVPLVLPEDTNVSWKLPNIPKGIFVEGEPDVSLSSTYITGSGSQFNVVAAREGSFGVIARLYPNGPILAKGVVNAFSFGNASLGGGGVIIRELPDGRKLVRMSYVLNGPIPPDLRIKITVWAGGSKFEDGSNVRYLTAADFDENGVAYLNVETSGAICQRFEFFLAE